MELRDGHFLVEQLIEDRANLLVIRAAPRTLEALQEARRYVVGAYECAFPDETENARVLQQIDEAIEAATKEV